MKWRHYISVFTIALIDHLALGQMLTVMTIAERHSRGHDLARHAGYPGDIGSTQPPG